MTWNKDSLKDARIKAKMSQTSLAEAIGIHFRTVQNWEKGITPIPNSAIPALDKLFYKAQPEEYVTKEKYDKVVAALESATDLNKRLTDIIQSGMKKN
jgi:transcriptional regulator with XRE-family HTH domain